ncbi:7632_t:CDS:1, partial [Entrophospora sp. SA101]
NREKRAMREIRNELELSSINNLEMERMEESVERSNIELYPLGQEERNLGSEVVILEEEESQWQQIRELQKKVRELEKELEQQQQLHIHQELPSR